MVARLRRLSPHLEEASADLGADTFQTFRLRHVPVHALGALAGGLLAFGLRFDEIIVTTFTAGAGDRDAAAVDLQQPLPAEPAADRQRGRGVVDLLSIIPVYLAHKLTREEGGAAPRAGGAEPVTAEATAVALVSPGRLVVSTAGGGGGSGGRPFSSGSTAASTAQRRRQGGGTSQIAGSFSESASSRLPR